MNRDQLLLLFYALRTLDETFAEINKFAIPMPHTHTRLQNPYYVFIRCYLLMNPISISLPKKFTGHLVYTLFRFGWVGSKTGRRGGLSSITISYYHNFSLRVLCLLNMLLSPSRKMNEKYAIFACYYFCCAFCCVHCLAPSF